MRSLTPAKLEQLRSLLSSFPVALREQLIFAAEHGDPSLARLLNFCATDPETAARRRFFAPVAPLSGDPETTRPSLAYAPPAVLETLWQWIGEVLAPDVAEHARALSSDIGSETNAGLLDADRVRAAVAILGALEAVRDNPREEKRLKGRLKVDDFRAVHDIAIILRAAPVLRAALEGLPEVIEEISDALSADIRDRYERANEEDPDAGAWFLYFVMARLTKPWRILRTFERIGKREDDLLLSRTDMAGIGEALLLDAEHHLDAFASPPTTADAAELASQALREFAAVTVGMTREIGIRKDGAWGQSLVALRGRASEQMEKIHARTRKVFAPILVAPKPGRAGRHDQPLNEDAPQIVEAKALASFLFASKDDASRAAVGGAHQQLMEELKTGMDDYGQALLRLMRDCEEAELAGLELRLEVLSRLMIALGEKEQSTILLRRGATARAA